MIGITMVAVIWLVVFVLVLFTIGYLGYSRYLAQFLELDESNETPAHKYEDGQEYVPSEKSMLIGHHFSSIAGGAPIVGPITAGVIWGWVPAILWIAIGNPLMGAVHDFTSLSASIRHEGKSIGYIIGEYVGDRGKNMLLWFAILTVILVIAVFLLVVGIVFSAYPSAATASLIYLGLGFLFGQYLYNYELPFIPGTVVFVIAVFASVLVGIQFPIAIFPAPDFPANTIILFSGGGSWLPLAGPYNPNVAAWVIVAAIYTFIAAVLPVWMLLQPRDYLASYLLYAGVGGTLLAVIVGTILGTATQPLTIGLEPYFGFWGTVGLPLFPLLFVTIACGTISGFHSIVSSGTTAKQLNKEPDARAIGYGGMLAEGLLGTVALATLAVVGITQGEGIALALPNFARGGGIILTALGVPLWFGGPFMALVLVSFLLPGTDTAVRLVRYMVEEIVETPETSVQETATNRYTNAVGQLVIAYVIIGSGTWTTLWPLFGGANQLLAALALLTGTIWIVNWDESKQLISTGVPVAIMAVITISALLWLAFVTSLWNKLLDASWMAQHSAFATVSIAIQIVIALLLVGLAISLIRIGYTNIKETRGGSGVIAADGGDRDPNNDD
jgi:carbon starvation protein